MDVTAITPMKAGVLAVGIVLMIVGVMIFLICYSQAAEYQTWVGQFARTLFPQAEKRYRLLILGEIFGTILGISGLGLTIYGAIAKEK